VAGENRRQARLVDLHEDLSARHPTTDLGHVRAHPLGERLGDVPRGAAVTEGRSAARQLERRGERPRPRHLHLERTRVAEGSDLEGVEIPLQQIRRGLLVVAGPGAARKEPPAARLQVDVQVGQEPGRPSDHVGADSAGRQLRQVRQVR
jgi:hypothetical protein